MDDKIQFFICHDCFHTFLMLLELKPEEIKKLKLFTDKEIPTTITIHRNPINSDKKCQLCKKKKTAYYLGDKIMNRTSY